MSSAPTKPVTPRAMPTAPPGMPSKTLAPRAGSTSLGIRGSLGSAVRGLTAAGCGCGAAAGLGVGAGFLAGTACSLDSSMSNASSESLVKSPVSRASRSSSDSLLRSIAISRLLLFSIPCAAAALCGELQDQSWAQRGQQILHDLG